MNDNGPPKKRAHRHRIPLTGAFLCIVWTIIIGIFLSWQIKVQQESIVELAAVEANASFNKDLVYRRWSAGHGGVYVPVTGKTPPNPYLSHIDERDITTPSGKKLTLINPAYMTRQVHELAAEQYGIRGHITSLNPIRSGNAPDKWEFEALKDMKNNPGEIRSVSSIDQIEYLRLMFPMTTEKGCLKCHAQQGYKEGDLRGGISVSIPLMPYKTIVANKISNLVLIHATILLFGFLIIIIAFFILSKQDHRQIVVEKALRKSEDDLKESQRIAQVGSWRLDLATNRVIWSEELYKIVGFDTALPPPLYTEHQKLFTAKSWTRLSGALKSTIEKRIPFELELETVRKDGRNGWMWIYGKTVLDERGVTVGLKGVAQEITDRKQVEEVQSFLAQTSSGMEGELFFNKLARFLARILDMSFICIDRLEGDGLTARTVSVWCDGHFDDNLTYTLKDTPCGDVVGKTICCFPANVCQLFPKDQVLQDLQAESYIGVTLFSHAGQPIGLIAVIGRKPLMNRSLAESAMKLVAVRAAGEMERLDAENALKESEKQKIRLEYQLQQAQKMESIGTLAGGIAHDFNNILFPIVGHTEMLLEDISDENSSFGGSLNEIHKSALRARDLVQQILTFSRQGKSELKLLKMQPIIKEALKLIRSTIPTTIAIKQNLQSDCGAVKADPTQIHQIVMNLTTNAYHAMAENGGELKVNLKEIELGEDDLIYPNMIPGVYACLTVADTGMGITNTIMDRIFEPFFTTKEKGKGTGMGLSVVHGIVKSMNGAIQVYSEPDKDTEFRVYLPVFGNVHENQEATIKEPLIGGSERILIVDDEDAIIVMEKIILERLGYHVSTHTSSIEALEAFRANPDKFDIVVTDMSMPKMSGDKLAMELIRIRPDIPILLCTGFSETMTNEKTKTLGIKGLLMKPVIKNDLAKKIREVLDDTDKNMPK